MQDEILVPARPNASEISQLKKVAKTAASEQRQKKLIRFIDYMMQSIDDMVTGYNLKKDVGVCLHDIEFLNRGLAQAECHVRIMPRYDEDRFEKEAFSLARINH